MAGSLPIPGEMTPDERLREIAATLACGILRLQKRRLLAAESTSQNGHEIGGTGLDVARDSSLTGPTGERFQSPNREAPMTQNMR